MNRTNRFKDLKACVALLLLCSLLVTACGAEPTPTPTLPLPTDTPVPAPSSTPRPAPTATPEPTPAPAARFEEASCPFELPDSQEEGETVDCGYLVVPEDSANPDSPEIRLAVAIFHPPGGATESDPIYYLAGGPGISELEFIWLSFDEAFGPLLAAGRDLVVFDQRGVGSSQPALDCPQVLEMGLEMLDGELDGQQLTDQEAYDLALETTLDCAQDLRSVADLAAYHTEANASDVNSLRLALGHDEVNLWATSYGTRLALEVMRDHPEGIRSVVLDSVYPPDVDLYGEGPANADRAFEMLFEACAADQACDAAYPELGTVFFDTVERLEKAPASFEIVEPFSGERYEVLLAGDDFATLVFGFIKMSDVLPSVPQIIDQASQDRFDLLATLLGVLTGLEEAASHGVFYSVLCHDEAPFTSITEFEDALADHPQWSVLFEESPVGGFGLEVCAGWESGQADALEDQAVDSDIPALILAGEVDPTTPSDWGRRAGETLPNSFFYEFPGVGHGASAVTGCPQQMMIDFFEDPSSSPEDACLAEMRPLQFDLPPQVTEIELEPFTNEEMDISGLVPAGWTEIGPGTYARSASELDATVLAAQAGPMSTDELLVLYVQQLGLEETPQAAGERDANQIAWTLYAFEVLGQPIDMALAERDGMALVVLLQTSHGEHDAMYEGVFLPVVDALVPLAQPAVDVAAAFVAALKDGDYEAAYELCFPDLRAEFGSADELGTWMVDNGIEPVEWAFSERNVGEDGVDLLGSIVLAGGQEESLEMVLWPHDGEWRVAGFHVR